MPKQIYFWLALIWTFVIAFLCLASFGNMPKVSLPGADKYVHFTFHFVFTWLWLSFLSYKNKKRSDVKTILTVFFLSVFYGIVIEILQGLLTTTRKEDIFDVFANMAGATAAVISILLYQKYIQKEKFYN